MHAPTRTLRLCALAAAWFLSHSVTYAQATLDDVVSAIQAQDANMTLLLEDLNTGFGFSVSTSNILWAAQSLDATVTSFFDGFQVLLSDLGAFSNDNWLLSVHDYLQATYEFVIGDLIEDLEAIREATFSIWTDGVSQYEVPWIVGQQSGVPWLVSWTGGVEVVGEVAIAGDVGVNVQNRVDVDGDWLKRTETVDPADTAGSDLASSDGYAVEVQQDAITDRIKDDAEDKSNLADAEATQELAAIKGTFTGGSLALQAVSGDMVSRLEAFARSYEAFIAASGTVVTFVEANQISFDIGGTTKSWPSEAWQLDLASPFFAGAGLFMHGVCGVTWWIYGIFASIRLALQVAKIEIAHGGSSE